MKYQNIKNSIRGGKMNKIKAFLLGKWIFEFKDFDWILVMDCNGWRSAHVGEEVQLRGFKSKAEALRYLDEEIAKSDRRNCILYKRVSSALRGGEEKMTKQKPYCLRCGADKTKDMINGGCSHWGKHFSSHLWKKPEAKLTTSEGEGKKKV